MRSLEQRSQRHQRDHAAKRNALMETLSQQSARIATTESSLRTLREENDALRKRTGSMLAKLNRFANGCWKFPSASVKKMSEALHIQVR